MRCVTPHSLPWPVANNPQSEAEFASPKAPLLARYRFALEQAIAKTNLLADLDFTVLTALVLYLTVVRRHDDSRFCWTTTGLAIRIAQGLGLHRDGTRFGLPPLEVEMRRRVWWACCSLDMRCAEEAGTDLTIVNRTFDTEFPTNIDDADIGPETTEMSAGREGLTDTAVALVRHETLALCRRLFALATAAGSVCPKDAGSSMAERERMLVEVYERVETTFLRHLASTSSPVSVMIAMVARIVMAKSSLIIYQPMLFPGTGPDLSSEIKERLFVSAVEIVEYVRRLNTDPQFKRWRWLFQTYTHWHAVAYILLEMTQRAWTPPLERAWADLNGSLADEYAPQMTRSADHLAVWMPLRRLLLKARRHREAEVARLRRDPAEVRRLEREDKTKSVRSCFGHVPGMEVDHARVRREWLALVAPEGVSPQRSEASIPNSIPHSAKSNSNANSSPAQGGPGMDYIDDLMDAPFNPLLLYRGAQQLELDGSPSVPTSGSSRVGTAGPSPAPMLWNAVGSGPMLGSALGGTMREGGMRDRGMEGEFDWESWQEGVRGLTGMGNVGWGL